MADQPKHTRDPFYVRTAEHLADEVAVLVTMGKLDARSPAADALLELRDPPQSERSDRLVALERERDALAAFKKYVHDRLTAAGIPEHEEANAVNGCRIGARLDDVLGVDVAALQVLVDDLAYQECDCPDSAEGYPVPPEHLCGACRAKSMSPAWQAAEEVRNAAHVAAWEAEGDLAGSCENPNCAKARNGHTGECTAPAPEWTI